MTSLISLTPQEEPAKPGDNLRIAAERLGVSLEERRSICGLKSYVEWPVLVTLNPLRALKVLETADLRALVTHIMREEPPLTEDMAERFYTGLFEATKDALPRGPWYSADPHRIVIAGLILRGAEDLGIGITKPEILQ